jgi:hypothetical protein
VPSGVNPASWVSFEARIEERRFRSLMAVVQQASDRGDGVAARLALEEARELRPEAAEIEALGDRVARLPIAQPVEVNHRVLRARTLRAASILLFGVTLVMALDWLRSGTSTVAVSDATWELDTPSGLDDPGLAASVARRSPDPLPLGTRPGPDLTARSAAGTSGDAGGDAGSGDAGSGDAGSGDAGGVPSSASAESPEPRRDVPEPRRDVIAAAPRTVASAPPGRAESLPLQSQPLQSQPLQSQPLPTSLLASLPVSGEIPDDYVTPLPGVRPRDEPGRTTPRGEVPDDYVAPAGSPAGSPPSLSSAEVALAPARPEGRSTRDLPAPGAPVANVVRQPASGSPGVTARTSTAAPVERATPAAAAAERLETASLAAGEAASPAAGAAAASAVVVPRNPETEVTSVLEQYASAYGRLDARAARRIWPTVNEGALAAAFAGLESQNVTFDACEIDVQGATANASCRGRARYVVKVGSREPRTEPRSWQIALRRTGEDWVIDSVRTSR